MSYTKKKDATIVVQVVILNLLKYQVKMYKYILIINGMRSSYFCDIIVSVVQKLKYICPSL